MYIFLNEFYSLISQLILDLFNCLIYIFWGWALKSNSFPILTQPQTICVTLSQFPPVLNWNNFIDLGAIPTAKWVDTVKH